MRKVILSLAAVCLLAGCATSQRAGSDTASATPSNSVSQAPTTSASPIVSESPTPSTSPSQASTNGDVVVGPATVGGKLGAEPTVVIDTTVAPAKSLVIKDIAVGTGKSVKVGGTVTAHYVGYGAATGNMFDGSWSRNEPVTFPLEGVILGWQNGLVGMKEGGRRVLVIPADQGYGDNPPAGSGIEPGETLVFVVDLLATQ